MYCGVRANYDLINIYVKIAVEKHKLERLNFARMNLKQPIEYWRTFLFTDECCSKFYANRAGRVLRTPKDEWNPKYFLRSVKQFFEIKVWRPQYFKICIKQGWFWCANCEPKQILRTKVLRTSYACAPLVPAHLKFKMRTNSYFLINSKQFQYKTLYFAVV
ncbi:Transposase_Tc1-like protein [Hexamita inflata]|uniref:Transposase Tc1-like protein n=1 Tax=Hexamita inflata TaxID=28002 RepID=A0AA86NU16_9EUKA|nr:Transposase Tc1-like protein [Hexamita inflata]